MLYNFLFCQITKEVKGRKKFPVFLLRRNVIYLSNEFCLYMNIRCNVTNTDKKGEQLHVVLYKQHHVSQSTIHVLVVEFVESEFTCCQWCWAALGLSPMWFWLQVLHWSDTGIERLLPRPQTLMQGVCGTWEELESQSHKRKTVHTNVEHLYEVCGRVRQEDVLCGLCLRCD